MGFALDEYVGLPVGHPQTYREVLLREVCERIGMDPARLHVPDGTGETEDGARGRRGAYEEAIRAAGGVDVQILGIGANGHLGFNEPASSLSSRTRVKRLSARTRRDNARFFDSLDDVPTHCVTQGLGTVLDARCLVLVATGEAKAAAVAAAVEGPSPHRARRRCCSGTRMPSSCSTRRRRTASPVGTTTTPRPRASDAPGPTRAVDGSGCRSSTGCTVPPSHERARL